MFRFCTGLSDEETDEPKRFHVTTQLLMKMFKISWAGTTKFIQLLEEIKTGWPSLGQPLDVEFSRIFGYSCKRSVKKRSVCRWVCVNQFWRLLVNCHEVDSNLSREMYETLTPIGISNDRFLDFAIEFSNSFSYCYSLACKDTLENPSQFEGAL